MRAALLILFSLVLTVDACASAPEYKIDRNHSNLGFSVPILGGLSQVRGKFSEFSVELKFDAASLSASSIRAVVKPGSIDTGIADRDEHLRSPDFFSVAEHPEAVFESTRIAADGEGFIAHGRLTMRGVTKEVELPFSLTGRAEKADDQGRLETVGFTASMVIDRRDFGMTWKHSVDPLFVGDLITLEISLVTRPRRLP